MDKIKQDISHRGWINRAGSIAAAAILVAAFALLGVLPFVGDYVVLLGGLLGLVYALATHPRTLVSPVAVLILSALALLVATLPFVYRGTLDLAPAGAVLLLLVTPGIAFILPRHRLSLAPLTIHILCLAGVTLAVLAGAGELLLTLNDRVGVGNNPIHYAALSVVLGFLAVPGVIATTSKWRIAFLLGPVMAVAAAVLSGSRGPLLAALILGVVTAVLLLVWMRRDLQVMLALLAVALLGGAGLVLLSTSGRALSIFDALAGIASGSTAPIDDYRQAMYHMAWQVLTTTPLHGWGFGQIMAATTAANPALDNMSNLNDLHSDPANFIAAAGIPGLLAYLALLAAPLTLFRNGQRRLNMTIILLAVGQFVLGLTNTTFGILPQTMLYAAALGYCLALASACQSSAGDRSSDNLSDNLAAAAISG